MRTSLWVALGVSLALAVPSQAGDLALTWEWPHALGTPPWHLLMVRTAQGDTQQQTLTLVALTPTDCKTQHQTVWKDAYDPAQTWCATLPCPGPGAYMLLLQAGDSLPTDPPATLGLDAQCRTIPYEEALRQALPIAPAPIPPGAPPRPGTPVLPPTAPVTEGPRVPFVPVPPRPPAPLPGVDAVPEPAPLPPSESPAAPEVGLEPEPAPEPRPPTTPAPRESPAAPTRPTPAEPVTPQPEPPAPRPTFATLEQDFHALDVEYHTRLRAIETAYEAERAQLLRLATPSAFQRLWQVYRDASAQRLALFRDIYRRWAELYTLYEALLEEHAPASDDPTPLLREHARRQQQGE